MEINIKTAETLVNTYNNITLEMIECYEFDNLLRVAGNLTGFGSRATCSLCKEAYNIYLHSENEVWDICYFCVYYKEDVFTSHCMNKENSDTFYAISDAETSEQLYEAYKNRIPILKSAIEKAKLRLADMNQSVLI